MDRVKRLSFLFFTLIVLLPGVAMGQITAPGADMTDQTSYPVFQEDDEVFIFCASDAGSEIGALRATTQLTGTKTFLWELYNNQTGAFDFYFSESTDGNTSSLSNLADGCYRLTLSQGATTLTYRAWVFNHWISAAGEVSESNCDFFRLTGSVEAADLVYYDLANNSPVNLNKDIRVEWKEGEAVLASTIDYQNFAPPTQNTDYTLRVYDNKYGCESSVTVPYVSLVTKAVIGVDPPNGEAPLTVTFENKSENGDAGQYEWFLYEDLDFIKREGENFTSPDDSFMVYTIEDSPVYTYENSGTYDVKLVSKKVSEFFTCTDTVKIDNYIVVDTSFIAVPNVFTPNGDGTNDQFVVRYWSMESLEISIFNRWGKRIHHWKKSDIQGFETSWTESVWDGRLMGGRFASPGVYFYVVSGRGRDGEKRRTHGFFHLFRGKD